MRRRSERQRRQRPFNRGALRFEPRRQDERLSEVRRLLVHREAGAIGGEFEQHAAGLPEVHRLEPEAIDHRRRVGAAGIDPRPDLGLVLLVVHPPREMVHAADAPRATPRFERVLQIDDAGGILEAVPCPAALSCERLEAEEAGQEVSSDRRVARI